MAGKKKRAGTVSLADALTATRAARRRVLALAERLEATERTILAAMASSPAAATTPAAPAKRPAGRPLKAPAAPAKRPVGRPPKAASAAPAKRPVGRPRTRPAAGRTPKG